MKNIFKQLITFITNIIFVFYWHLTFFRPRNRAFGRYVNYHEALVASKTDYSNEKLIDQIYLANKNVVSGRYIYERDGVNYDYIQYSYQLNMHIGSIVDEKIKNRLINVLDFGGGFGTIFRQFPNKNIINNWSIIEQDRMIEIGSNEFSTAKLDFCSLNQINHNSSYDVLILGAVIDLIENYQSVITDILGKCNPEMIIIDRTLFTDLPQDFWTVKNTNKNISDHKKYPLCFLSENLFLSFMENIGYEKKDEWLTSDKKLVNGMQIGTYKGFCYQKKII